jgi:hypothetical protein
MPEQRADTMATPTEQNNRYTLAPRADTIATPTEPHERTQSLPTEPHERTQLRGNMNAGLEHLSHLIREAGRRGQRTLRPVHGVRDRLQSPAIDGDVLRYTRSTLPIRI